MTGNPPKETLVVGSGASGLTMALLMAKAGRKVRLVESQKTIGGYLNRFTREGRRFDTGFHFTGSFEGVLGEMLAVLGMSDDVRERPLAVDAVLAETETRLSFPDGDSSAKAELFSRIFPDRVAAIGEYYRIQSEIARSTPLFSLKDARFAESALSNYDSVTLSEFLDSLGVVEPELRTLLGLMSVCHGTPPSEVPLTHHCRAGFGLDERIRSVDGGGDAFVDAFRRELSRYGVTVATSCEVAELMFSADGSRCAAARLSDGDVVEVDDIFFAVHPSAFLPLLPENSLYKPLWRRASRFSETCGFFSVCALAKLDEPPSCAKLVHYISENDLDRVLLPGNEAYGTGMMLSPAKTAGQECKLVAFRTMHVSEMPCERGTDRYIEFKEECTAAVIEDVCRAMPMLKGKLRVVDAASPLTFRRYAPPSGSAYGVRRKIAESRISGTLPAKNLHAVGHNALMPGVVGVMSGAFVEFRRTVGEGAYFELLGKTDRKEGEK